MKGKDISEFQADTDGVHLVSILKFQPWIKNKHRLTNSVSNQNALLFPVDINSQFELKIDKQTDKRDEQNRFSAAFHPTETRAL